LLAIRIFLLRHLLQRQGSLFFLIPSWNGLRQVEHQHL
jgi:hypothetical protein